MYQLETTCLLCNKKITKPNCDSLCSAVHGVLICSDCCLSESCATCELTVSKHAGKTVTVTIAEADAPCPS